MLTTKEVGKHYKISDVRVRQIATSRGIEPAMTVGNAYLWHDRDLARFKPNPPGKRWDLTQREKQ